MKMSILDHLWMVGGVLGISLGIAQVLSGDMWGILLIGLSVVLITTTVWIARLSYKIDRIERL